MSDQPGVDTDGKHVYPLDRIWEPIGSEHWIDRRNRGGVEVGAAILHKNPATGRWCMSGINYDIPQALYEPENLWQLQSLDPLHVEPSILCNSPTGPNGEPCKDHGHIRDGKWVPA